MLSARPPLKRLQFNAPRSIIESMKEQEMGTAKIWKLCIKMGIPTVMAQVVNLLYNIVDRIYIGNMPDAIIDGVTVAVGKNALGGLGLCAPIITLIAAFSAFVSGGGAPLAAKALGEGDAERAGRYLNNGFVMLTAFSVILGLAAYIFAEPLLYFIGAGSGTFGYAYDYLTVYLIGTLFVQLATGLNTFLTAQGKSVTAMLSVLVGAVLNIGLDPLFIFTFGMGVKGAALATVLSQACSALWVLLFLTSRKASLRLERKYLRTDRKIVLATLALGVSPFIMASTESLVGFVLNSSLKAYGDIYISALAIMQSAMLAVSVPLTGFAQGFIPIVSYNYGHGNRERVKECFRIVLAVMFTFNFVLVMFMILFPHVVASAFTSDGRLIATVEQTLPLFLAGMTIFGLQCSCQNMFVALGQAGVSVFIALLRKVFLLVPLALLLPRWWGMMGVFGAEGISDAVAAVCCTLIFVWRFPRILRRMEKAEKRAVVSD